MAVVIFFVIHWYTSLFFQTFFQHRYAAHRQFTMSKTWEKIFFVLAYLFQGSSYLSPRAYGILHRLHHAHADTPEDPHSPMYQHNIFAMMWRTRNIYSAVYQEKYPVPDSFKKNLPRWDSFDAFAESMFSRIGWSVIYFGIYYLLGAQWWMYLTLYPITIIMGPFHGAIINWFAHKFGTQPHEISDTSRNMYPIDLIMMGEGYHNNHHKFPHRSNFGMKWYELDPSYMMIRLFSSLGIIKMVKTAQPASAAKAA